MINRYKWWEYIAIYAGIALFLSFILAPFVEAFVVSLRPLDSIFSIPYRFLSEGMSFEAYFSMWESVPLLWLYILCLLYTSDAADE